MRMHLGITEMLKGSIIALTAIGFLFWGVYSHGDVSRHYWESVGPRWDKMFNPSHYK
jgi:hypothetical protein